jgi:hypothetical protein
VLCALWMVDARPRPRPRRAATCPCHVPVPGGRRLEVETGGGRGCTRGRGAPGGARCYHIWMRIPVLPLATVLCTGWLRTAHLVHLSIINQLA